MTETKESNNKLIKMPKVWPSRLRVTFFILLIIFGMAAITIILQQKVIQSQIQKTQNYIVNIIGQHGFSLQDIIISGRSRTSLDEINKTIALQRGDNFFSIDITQLKRNLEELPWVRDVTVKRNFLPNTIQINIKEKDVMAIWQLHQHFYPIDFDGYVIEAEYRPNKPLLLIVGEDAPEHILELLQAIKQIDASYLPRIKAANYISKRRWNIIFDDVNNGITVKLPSGNFIPSLTKLINLDKTSAILKRKLTIIDLRLSDKIIVKMRKGGLAPDIKPRAL